MPGSLIFYDVSLHSTLQPADSDSINFQFQQAKSKHYYVVTPSIAHSWVTST